MTSIAATAPVKADVRPSIAAALLAPLAGIVAPAGAARCLQGASGFSLLLTALVYAIACATTIIAINLSFDLLKLWLSGPLPSVSLRSLWLSYHSQGSIGPLELAFLALTGGILLLPVIATLFFLPGLSAAGRLMECLTRGYRAGVAALGWLIVMVLLFGVLLIFAEFRASAELIWNRHIWYQAFSAICIPSLIWWLIARVSRAYSAARPNEDEHVVPPVCEGCGYGLTVIPSAGRCPECALPTDESLLPGRRRPGSRWQQSASLVNWLRDAFDLVLRPGHFYRKVRLRDDVSPLVAFARWNYLAMAIVAWWWGIELFSYQQLSNFSSVSLTDDLEFERNPWTLLLAPTPVLLLALGLAQFLCLFRNISRRSMRLLLVGACSAACPIVFAAWILLISGFSRSELAILPIGIGLLAPLVCWTAQRTIGAIATSVAFWNGTLRDGRWAEKVVLCESVFMWIFCIWWGLLVTSFVVADFDWLTQLIGEQFSFDVLRMPAELAALIYGGAFLGLLALLRYRTVFRAIRWANF